MKKSNANDHIRLQHMLDAAQQTKSFMLGRNPSDLEDNAMLAFAVVHALGMIGEAANQVTDELHHQHPQIQWRQIVSMRHWIVHAYFAVDMAVIWKTVQEDIPILIENLQQILVTNKSET